MEREEEKVQIHCCHEGVCRKIRHHHPSHAQALKIRPARLSYWPEPQDTHIQCKMRKKKKRPCSRSIGRSFGSLDCFPSSPAPIARIWKQVRADRGQGWRGGKGSVWSRGLSCKVK